jgi:hypothetical protein
MQSMPLWRLRLATSIARYLVLAAAVAGLAASARYALDPPRAQAPMLPDVPPRAGVGARAFATLFARRYLEWNASDPEAHRRGLEPFAGSGQDADAGMQLPTQGVQRVLWAEVVQERAPSAGTHVFTVAAQTDSSGLLYLSVTVVRRSDGGLALGAFPAFVGPPGYEASTFAVEAHESEVHDPTLVTVVRRALGNYLADSPAELQADLTREAKVSPPPIALTLDAMPRLDWAGSTSLRAVVQATGAHEAQYTLAYELDMARAGGRWEIAAIQMSPYA